ncbi:MFS general substrate transporter [Lentinus tigrinus ALCF2SS1-7]|uniref:MFS general substrate transporter n=1 Tax=Lentinus tigrinus ALCF2SS1-6 TaxID=1328759 RepID=A0A5C2SS96_9APHY|nr:MFS general substrate transporter [Lentinus tigrinus ALCF2SS1-6]RPD80226.1 MFS general substrate transporter [Lentinus tigrinus ALCF2SS1-7]
MVSGAPARVTRVRSVLTCCAVAANAICAGGVYSFPLIAPTLLEHLKLSQPQLTTIVLAGMATQYLVAAFCGVAIDRYGSWSCSFAATILYSLGFGLFAREVALAAPGAQASTASFYRLVLYFGMIGLATVCSYFSLVFASTKMFPRYSGTASGTSMSIFGLSPLFLSLLASKLFTTSDQSLDIPGFFTFMAVITGVVHCASTLVFHANRPFEVDAGEEAVFATDAETTTSVFDSEEEPLLGGSDDGPSKDPANVHVVPVEEPQDGSTLDLFRDRYFWVLCLWMTLSVGAAEMVISNLGSIVLSLPSMGSSATANAAQQVRLLSFFNTISRLLVGPLADVIAPVASRLDSGVWGFASKRHTSRVSFMLGTCALLAVTFAWLNVGVRAQEDIWPLSVGTGFAYGATFTVLPGILSSIWGLKNLARNFGIVSYTAFAGTTIFSYLYAFVAARHVSPSETACIGKECWRSTFWISTGTSVVAFSAAFVLWRQWRARV